MKMTKEQFVKVLKAYLSANGYAPWEPWDIEAEWSRYDNGRAWSNEFFSKFEDKS